MSVLKKVKSNYFVVCCPKVDQRAGLLSLLTVVWKMCVNNLSKVALVSATAGIETAASSRLSNALTTAPPSGVSALSCIGSP